MFTVSLWVLTGSKSVFRYTAFSVYTGLHHQFPSIPSVVNEINLEILQRGAVQWQNMWRNFTAAAPVKNHCPCQLEFKLDSSEPELLNIAAYFAVSPFTQSQCRP